MTPADQRLERLRAVLGDRVDADPGALEAAAGDVTENPPHRPLARVSARSVDEVAQVLRLATELGLPVTPRVQALNVGGLAIPEEGGLVLDLAGMDRVLHVDPDAMYALVEPGVSWQALKQALAPHGLVVGYPLAPPETSVAAGCLMDGLGTLTLRHGPMGEWINGVEAVLASGEVVRTGAGAISPVWFSRSPLPDLTGLFVNWQGTTGIVTKLAVQAWPQRALRQRLFVLFDDAVDALALLRRLGKSGLFDDVGGLSWPISRVLLGDAALWQERARWRKDPGEPELYLYVDLSADGPRELAAKRAALDEALERSRADGAGFQGPLDAADLAALDPAFVAIADLPARIDGLLDHPGGGLTWLGTYGPPQGLLEGARRGLAILADHGFPPLLVTRPMRGGHFCVLRFIELFDRGDAPERERLARAQQALLRMLLDLGYLPYKAPAWTMPALLERCDPGMRRLVAEVRRLVDPAGILSPGRWWR